VICQKHNTEWYKIIHRLLTAWKVLTVAACLTRRKYDFTLSLQSDIQKLNERQGSNFIYFSFTSCKKEL
jgi:hypothetical protein